SFASFSSGTCFSEYCRTTKTEITNISPNTTRSGRTSLRCPSGRRFPLTCLRASGESFIVECALSDAHFTKVADEGAREKKRGQATFLAGSGGVLLYGVWMRGRASLTPLGA